MKKAISMALALVLALSLSTAAFAADTTNNGGNTNVDLLGEASSTKPLISVIMPTSVSFQIATKDETGTKVFDRLVSADGVVTNNSNCEVALSVVEVTDSNPSLLTHVDLGLAPKGTTLQDAMKTYKLTAGQADIKLGLIQSAGTLTLNVFGQDNDADTTTLDDGKYTVGTIIKVAPAAVI